MTRGAVFVLMALSLAAQPALHPAAGKALSGAYRQLDAAYSTGDAASAGMLIDAAARRIENGVNYLFSDALKAARANPQPTRSLITSVGVTTDGALVLVRQHRGLTVNECADKWSNGPFGWRLVESRVLAMHQQIQFDDASLAQVRQVLAARSAKLKDDPAARPFDDLADFGKAVGGARIVLLGEAATGSRETARAKHRLAAYLIESKGFTVFVNEASWPDARALDRYINGRDTALMAALSANDRWEWDTAEAADLAEWMKTRNALLADRPALRFDSLGAATPAGATRLVLAYLSRYSQDNAKIARLALAPVVEMETTALERSALPRALVGTRQVYTLLQTQRDALVAKSGQFAWEEAVQGAVVAYQALTVMLTARLDDYQSSLAENLVWLAAVAYPKQKIIVWTSNDNARAGKGGSRVTAELSKRFPGEVYRLGVVMGGGSVRAVRAEDNPAFSLATREVPNPPASSAAGVVLAQLPPASFLDLRAIEASTLAGKWLAAPGLFYDFGPAWTSAALEANMRVYALGEAFDGVLIVRATSPVTPLVAAPIP